MTLASGLRRGEAAGVALGVPEWGGVHAGGDARGQADQESGR